MASLIRIPAVRHAMRPTQLRYNQATTTCLGCALRGILDTRRGPPADGRGMSARTKLVWLALLPGVGCAVLGVMGFLRIRQAYAAAPHLRYSSNWNPRTAAHYLDQREVWWQSWDEAKEDRGTICISCHTVVPYALARPVLREHYGPDAMTPEENVMLASVKKRVSEWPAMNSFYNDAKNGRGKTAQSRATEAVLNAVILASYDAGQGQLSPLSRTAFDEAWALQLQAGPDAGGWQWQTFGLAPWESNESAYQGAAMLAIALEDARGHYADNPGTADHVVQLRQYLQRLYPTQPLMSQIYVLWASAQMPGLLTDQQRSQLLETIRRLQQPDGGWNLFALDGQQSSWKLKIGAPQDGCATGLVAVALQKSGVRSDDPMLRRGLDWLRHHQETNGSWYGPSLNRRRNIRTDVGQFMSDAATGYAVLALESAQPHDIHTQARASN